MNNQTSPLSSALGILYSNILRKINSFILWVLGTYESFTNLYVSAILKTPYLPLFTLISSLKEFSRLKTAIFPKLLEQFKMKQFISSCIILCLIISLSACKQKKETSNQISYPASITIGSYFQAVDYAPFLIAKKKGWFDEALIDEGITINYEIFEDLAVINDAFLKDKLDVVFEAEPPAIVSESANVGIDIMDISCSFIPRNSCGK